jgi:hypothetical protein
MSAVKGYFEKISTEGDFVTNSNSWVDVPDSDLKFSLEKPGAVFIAADVFLENCAEVAYRTDEVFHGIVIRTEQKNIQFQACVTFMQWFAAGPHTISMAIRFLDGIPNGPREWSPRFEKNKEVAKLIRSAECPLRIRATLAD